MTTHSLCVYPALCECGCGRVPKEPHCVREDTTGPYGYPVSVAHLYAPECCPECREEPNAS